MVKLTQAVCRARYHKRIKEMYQRRGVYKVQHTTAVARAVTAKGCTIEDPVAFVNPPQKEVTPDKSILYPSFLNEGYLTQEKEKDPTEYKQVWHLTNSTHFTKGVKQACILTKAKRVKGLPPQIDQLVGKYSVPDQNQRQFELIRHSQQWENSKDKLPKRRDLENLSWIFRREFGILDTKSGMYILNDFLRLAQSQCSVFPELATQRRVMCKPEIHVQYQWQDSTININTISEMLVLGQRELPPLADRAAVLETVDYTMPNMYPILPTIDLEQRLVKIGEQSHFLKKDAQTLVSHPQIVMRRNSSVSPRSNQASNLLVTFATAVSEARTRYGIESGHLEKPVTVMNINCTYNSFNFLVFQLNTLDLTSSDGVKNIVWSDSNNELFKRVKCQPWKNKNKYTPDEYVDFNEKVFQKFLALYLYSYAS